jgi:GT2 family glycosyltransferase
MLEDMRRVYGYCYDERFGTGYEDLDLWFRMQHRGWKALFCPAAKAWHVGSASAGGASGFLDKPPDYQRRLFRNRRLIWMKNVTPGMRQRLGWRWRLFEAAIPFYLLVRSPRALGPWWNGRRDAARLGPALAAEARHAARAATVPEAELLALIR